MRIKEKSYVRGVVGVAGASEDAGRRDVLITQHDLDMLSCRKKKLEKLFLLSSSTHCGRGVRQVNLGATLDGTCWNLSMRQNFVFG